MLRLLPVLLLASIIFWFYTPIQAQANEESNYFVVTAYYSPLPDQEYYITGDYYKELRLNGQWIAGASWKGVFSGMLAAPAKYWFGTKIYLDGLGIGSVEDRGGAIVPAGQRWYSYDRIDVWMGYGDEGLRRANFWGKRTVYGYVVDSWNTTSIDYTQVPAPGWAVTGLKKAGTTTTISTPVISENYAPIPETTIFDISLAKWSDTEYISEMQSVFEELWYMWDDYSDGEYDEVTIDSIVAFQLKYELISDPYELWAGSYGPKTRTKLKELYDTYIQEIAEKEALLEDIEALTIQSETKAQEYVGSLWNPTYGDISPSVRELQKSLTILWYFDYKDTAIFGVKTQNALIEYQLDKKIIQDATTLWAWIFWPKTREQFITDMSELYFKELLEENELYDRYLENKSIEEKISEDDEELEEILQNIFEEQISVI